MNVLTQLPSAQQPSAVALGNFDGVHRGHVQVLQQVLALPTPTVLTFEPHPQEFFRGETGFLLTPLAEKIPLLADLGFAQTLVLPFTAALAKLTAAEFVEQILVQGLGANWVSIGPDFQFGYQRTGNATVLKTLGQRYGFTVNVTQEERWMAGERVSSSAIRQALSRGDCATATALLGRAYTLSGEVIHGEQRGRTLGFATANLAVTARKFIPANGVYVVDVQGLDQPLQGVLNIGYRPTFDGQQRSIEVHILDWQGDIYGKTLTLALQYYLRRELKFSGFSALQTQINQDIAQARQWLKARPAD